MTNLPRAPGQPPERGINTGYSGEGACPPRESSGGAGWGRGPSGSGSGRGRPSRRRVAGLRDRPATLGAEEAPANYVPAAAVTRRGRALSGFIGRKARAGGAPSGTSNLGAQPPAGSRTGALVSGRGGRNSRCSGGMRRYREEHRWRRQTSGPRQTLRRES